MWIITMFDLPTETAKDKRAYVNFRKALLEDGFIMIQFSIYIRHCASEENAVVHKKRLQTCLPPQGEVRILTVTDKQYERMNVFYGKSPNNWKNRPSKSVFSDLLSDLSHCPRAFLRTVF